MLLRSGRRMDARLVAAPFTERIDLMFIHAGNGRLLRAEEIIGIFDMDSATVAAETKEFLARSQREGRVISTSYELPKSFILTCDDMVTLSQFSSSSLLGRFMQ